MKEPRWSFMITYLPSRALTRNLATMTSDERKPAASPRPEATGHPKRAARSTVKDNEVSNELFEFLLPLLIRLDAVFAEVGAIEHWLEGALRCTTTYPSVRWYALLTPNTRVAVRTDPVRAIAQNWVSETSANRGGHVVFSAPGGVLGDNRMAGELRGWLRQAFKHRPKALKITLEAGGSLIVRVYFSGSKQAAFKRVAPSKQTPVENEYFIRSGWFLSKEADSVESRLEFLETKYDIVSQRAIIDELRRVVFECREIADVLVRNPDPLTHLIHLSSPELAWRTSPEFALEEFKRETSWDGTGAS